MGAGALLLQDPPKPPLGRVPRHAACAVAASLCLLTLAACSERPREIPETRNAPAEPVERSTSAERFGFTAAEPEAAHDHAGEQAAYTWQLPPGWRALPPTPMRAASFAVEKAPEIDCSLTILPAGGGGLGANLNRWRKQMSLEDLTDAELSAVPTLPVLGGRGQWLECEGTYRGMGNETPREDAKLLGVAVEHEGNAVFVKMVGPAAAVQRERDHFEAFCRSLAPGAAAAHVHTDAGATTPAPPAATAPAAGASAPSAWDAPPTWKRVEASPLRLVSFSLGRNGDTECYVTVLEGSGGGLAANVNRWRQQMAQPDLSAAEIAALPEIPMLGTRARLVRIRGDFTGMDGASKSGAMMLASVCELGDKSVFVKMIGPAGVVEAEEERFAAFCRSLR